MTTIHNWLNHPYVLGTLLILGATVDLVLVGRAYDLSKSDWGTWVGSIGTVGTLVGTVLLATSEGRAKREEQRALALVATAGFIVRLRNLLRGLANARAVLTEPLAQHDDARVTFAECFEFIEDHDLWTAEELVPLLYLPRQTAARLAKLGIDARTTKAKFKKASEQDAPWDAVELLARVFVAELTSTLERAERVYVECTAFLVAHGFETT